MYLENNVSLRFIHLFKLNHWNYNKCHKTKPFSIIDHKVEVRASKIPKLINHLTINMSLQVLLLYQPRSKVKIRKSLLITWFFFFNIPCSRNHTKVTEKIGVFGKNIVSQVFFNFWYFRFIKNSQNKNQKQYIKANYLLRMIFMFMLLFFQKC